jgi:hypothetical protein
MENKEEKTFQPALDTHKISVGMVIGRIDKQGTELFLQNTSAEMQQFWERYIRMVENHRTLDAILVSELKN